MSATCDFTLAELMIVAASEAWRGNGEHGRVIRMRPESTIEPGASGEVSAVGLPQDLVLPSDEAVRDFHWKIVGAKGYRLD